MLLPEQSADRLRLRDMRKDGLLGSIYRNNDKKISQLTFSTNNIAVQVDRHLSLMLTPSISFFQLLEDPDDLSEEDIVLILKKRERSTRKYIDGKEIVLKGLKKPTVNNLKACIAKSLGLIEEGCIAKLTLVKYFPYEFTWREISETTSSSGGEKPQD